MIAYAALGYNEKITVAYSVALRYTIRAFKAKRI